MDWLEDVAAREKRKNQVLFSKTSELLHGLDQLARQQSHRTMVLWAFDLAEESVLALERRYPRECRPRNALETSKEWAAGRIKMPVAKRSILECHALAKELSDRGDIALCHAVGQACSVVHTPGHALGYPIYELTALVRRYGVEHCRDAVEARSREYVEKLLYWAEHTEDYEGAWAAFLTKDRDPQGFE